MDCCQEDAPFFQLCASQIDRDRMGKGWAALRFRDFDDGQHVVCFKPCCLQPCSPLRIGMDTDDEGDAGEVEAFDLPFAACPASITSALCRNGKVRPAGVAEPTDRDKIVRSLFSAVLVAEFCISDHAPSLAQKFAEGEGGLAKRLMATLPQDKAIEGMAPGSSAALTVAEAKRLADTVQLYNTDWEKRWISVPDADSTDLHGTAKNFKMGLRDAAEIMMPKDKAAPVSVLSIEAERIAAADPEVMKAVASLKSSQLFLEASAALDGSDEHRRAGLVWHMQERTAEQNAKQWTAAQVLAAARMALAAAEHALERAQQRLSQAAEEKNKELGAEEATAAEKVHEERTKALDAAEKKCETCKTNLEDAIVDEQHATSLKWALSVLYWDAALKLTRDQDASFAEIATKWEIPGDVTMVVILLGYLVKQMNGTNDSPLRDIAKRLISIVQGYMPAESNFRRGARGEILCDGEHCLHRAKRGRLINEKLSKEAKYYVLVGYNKETGEVKLAENGITARATNWTVRMDDLATLVSEQKMASIKFPDILWQIFPMCGVCSRRNGVGSAVQLAAATYINLPRRNPVNAKYHNQEILVPKQRSLVQYSARSVLVAR